MNPMSLEARHIPYLWKSHLSNPGKHTSPSPEVLCPASIPCHPQVPHPHLYTNTPVEKAATSQSCLLPHHPLTAPCPRVRATIRPLQESLQTIPQPCRAPQKMWIVTWPLIGSPSNLTTIKGSCLLQMPIRP